MVVQESGSGKLLLETIFVIEGFEDLEASAQSFHLILRTET